MCHPVYKTYGKLRLKMTEGEGSSRLWTTSLKPMWLCRIFSSFPNHPMLAENIASDGGPGNDIIVVRLQPLNNSWV